MGMINRSICIFPEFNGMKEIENVREKYDPLHSFIPPHITLVHPFISSLSKEELIDHMRDCLACTHPFNIKCQNVTGAEGHYLFLNVKKGNDDIIDLRDRLYSGILKRHYKRELSYMPHVTVGKLDDGDTFKKALDDTDAFNAEFTSTIHKISVEQIGEDGTSMIEYEYYF
ncbi:2'-5' RNA ligase family protein [Lysinibacillus sphaericus]